MVTTWIVTLNYGGVIAYAREEESRRRGVPHPSWACLLLKLAVAMSSKQSTFGRSRIEPVPPFMTLQCEATVKPEGEEPRRCKNKAYVAILSRGPTVGYCHSHARDTWLEAAEAKK